MLYRQSNRTTTRKDILPRKHFKITEYQKLHHNWGKSTQPVEEGIFLYQSFIRIDGWHGRVSGECEKKVRPKKSHVYFYYLNCVSIDWGCTTFSRRWNSRGIVLWTWHQPPHCPLSVRYHFQATRKLVPFFGAEKTHTHDTLLEKITTLA